MPPKRKTKSKKVKPSNQNRELAQITRMLQQIKTSQPESNVTDLGKLLLKGGNLASSFFGFPKVFGSGSYAMTNSCWNSSQQVPVMHNSNESIRIRHREYITDINMNGPLFQTYPFAINPGLPQSFPYLSAIAQNFQEYSFKGLVFEFKTTSATALVSGSNTAMGSVMLAAQYRADAPVFTNKTQLLNEMWSVDTVPSQNVILPVECNPAETTLPRQYVRTGSVTGDIKLFDLCQLVVATYGAQTSQNNVVGELWVSYDVELSKPQLANTVAASGTAAFYGVSNTWATGNLFQGIIPSVASNVSVTFNTVNEIILPIGIGGYFLYSVAMVFSGTYGTGTVVYNNCHVASNNIQIIEYNAGALGSNSYGQVILVTAPSNQQATITIPSGQFPTGSGILTVTLISLPNLPILWGT